MAEKEMFKAAKAGDTIKVRALLAADPKLANIRDKEGSTPLHWAAFKNFQAVIEVLLDAGADIEAHNSSQRWGPTPLHAAANSNARFAAEILIERGADIHSMRDTDNVTPLAETKVNNATAVAKLLRDAGAIE